LCVFYVRLFFVYVISGETASRSKNKLMRTYHWISLFKSYIYIYIYIYIYTVRKLYYIILVILIANRRVKKIWR
jgi:hypothetical protein